MQVIVNNKPHHTQAATLHHLACELALPPTGIAVAIGSSIVPRTQWAETPLEENMNITIIKAVCGG